METHENTLPEEEHAKQTTSSSPEEPKQNTLRSTLWEIIKLFILAAIIVVPIRLYVASPFFVQGSSMEPTFETGHYLVVNQLVYDFKEPQRGDVIVFRDPHYECASSLFGPLLNALSGTEIYTHCKFVIKRIVGLPGEVVSLENGDVTITTRDKETLPLSEPYVVYDKPSTGSTLLGSDEYFVMGDNRLTSLDSRSWGALPERFITGKAFVRVFPLRDFVLHPGAYTHEYK